MSGDSELPFWLENEPKPASVQEMKLALFYSVQPDYLRTMRIALKRGRFVTERDDERAPLTVAVDEQLARKYFPGQDPLGHHLNLGLIGSAEIVGVVGHTRQESPVPAVQTVMILINSCVVRHRSRKANWPVSRTWRAASSIPVMAAR